MSDKFDEVMENGTDEEIEAAIAEMELSGNDLFGDDDEEEELPAEQKQEVIVEKAPTENDVTEAADKPAEAVPESSPAEDAAPTNFIEKDGKYFIEVSKDNAGLGSKNGKHQLPYELLVGARGEAAEIKAQLEEQRRLNAELQNGFDESKRVSELYSKQLGAAGLDPELLPEQMLNDPKLMAQIKEDYPQIGELVSALASKLQQAPAQQVPEQATTVSQNPVEDAFNQSANLKNWQTGDADRWEMAKLIDSTLAKDPSFDNKTPSERFLEVEKRVMNAFGDELPQAAAQQPAAKTATPEQQKSAPIPNTPTDIGHQGNDLNPNANLLDQDAGTMSVSMESMTDAQIEELLEGASNFL